MNLDENPYGNIQSTTLTDEESRIIEEIKEKVFDADVRDGLSIVEGLIQEWLPDAEGTVIEEFLKSLWNHFYAIRLIREEGDFAKTFSLIEEAANGFRQVGQQELADLSEGLSAYTVAIEELHK